MVMERKWKAYWLLTGNAGQIELEDERFAFTFAQCVCFLTPSCNLCAFTVGLISTATPSSSTVKHTCLVDWKRLGKQDIPYCPRTIYNTRWKKGSCRPITIPAGGSCLSPSGFTWPHVHMSELVLPAECELRCCGVKDGVHSKLEH